VKFETSTASRGHRTSASKLHASPSKLNTASAGQLRKSPTSLHPLASVGAGDAVSGVASGDGVSPLEDAGLAVGEALVGALLGAGVVGLGEGIDVGDFVGDGVKSGVISMFGMRVCF